jgi:gas vesicle protein
MNDSGEKFFTGLIVGAVLGIAIGLLNAPRPGVETRHMIKGKLDEFGNHIKEEREKANKSD